MDANSYGMRNKIMKSNSDKAKTTEGNSSLRKKRPGTLSSLAEAIILQSIEDLWLEKEKSDCMNFFTGESFHICANLSCMDFPDQVKVLNFVKNIYGKIRGRQQKKRSRTLKQHTFLEEKKLCKSS